MTPVAVGVFSLEVAMTNELDNSGELPTGQTAAELAARKFLDQQKDANGAQTGASTQVEATTTLPAVEVSEASSEAETKPTRRQINDGDTLSGIASEALGAGASVRDIYNYVRQIARYNHIQDENKIYADRWLEMPQYIDPRATAGNDTPVSPEAQNQSRQAQPAAGGPELRPEPEAEIKPDLKPAPAPEPVQPAQALLPESAGVQPDETVIPVIPVIPAAQEAASPKQEPATQPTQEAASLQPEPVAQTTQDTTELPSKPPTEQPIPAAPLPESKIEPKQALLTEPSRIIVEQPGSNLDKTLHVGGLAVAGAVEHVKEHPYLVTGEAAGGAVIGGLLLARGPAWLKAGAAIGGITYAGYTIHEKSKELMPALGTIYADRADQEELEKAEKVVKHDLGVGLVDGTTMVIGGIGAKVVAGKIAGKAPVVAVEEGAEAAAGKGAIEGAPKNESQSTLDSKGTAGQDQSGGSTNSVVDKTGSGNNTGVDKTGDKTGGTNSTGVDKTGDKTGGTNSTGVDKTGDKTGGTNNAGVDKSNTTPPDNTANNSPSNNSPSDKTASRDKSRVNDGVVPGPKPMKSASAEWTGNKYRNDDGSFRQEDSHWVSEDGRVALVADGMGGVGGGDTASLITTDVMKARMPLLSENASEKEAETWLKESIEAAAGRIKQAQAEGVYNAPDGSVHATTEGMGSTVVATVKHQGKMLIAWAGDSRAYRFRGGKLEQLTEDHSWDNEARKLGLSEEQIAAADQGHIIKSALGSTLKIDQIAVDIKPGDRFLLASDGLERLQPRQIEEVFNETSTPEETSNALIEAVKRVFNGMRIIDRLQDNTSVVVLEPNVPVPKPLPYVKPPVSRANIMPLRAAQPYAISAGWVNGVEDLNAKKAL